jgi:hypothetical protein
MKTIILALLLLITGNSVSAANVKFPDKMFSDAGVDDFEPDIHKPGSAYPWVDFDQLPKGLVVAAEHNNVPEGVLENLDKHPLVCCKAGASIQVVPLPAAAWLFMSGLVGLWRLGHRRKK